MTDTKAYRKTMAVLSNIHRVANSAPALLGANALVRSGGSEIFPLGALRCDAPSVSDVSVWREMQECRVRFPHSEQLRN